MNFVFKFPTGSCKDWTVFIIAVFLVAWAVRSGWEFGGFFWGLFGE